MKKQVVLWAGLIFLFPSIGLASVCSDGVGIPPFLSSGAKPNLLMVLDNSGSMLDAAYSKEGIRCMDGDYEIVSYTNKDDKIVEEVITGYDSSFTYGGYFKGDVWYKWTDGDYAPWQTGQPYNVGDRVYDYGNIYEAATAGTSTNRTPDKDTGVEWNHLVVAGIQPNLIHWANNRSYPAGSFAWDGPQLYYTATGGTSNDPTLDNGLRLSDDTGITDWTPVDSTWLSSKSYNAGDIVAYNGIHYESITGGTNKIPDKNKGDWKSLRQGGFVEISAAQAASHCSGATGTQYNRANNLCITVDNDVVPKKVNAFAARGNMLNWMLASKFDVQKKILTGGKHNYYEEVLVSEHRGCSGSRFIKQVQLDSGDYLTLGVRGAKHDNKDPFMRDRIDTTDDTARLEVLAITEDGFQPSAECQAMIEEITTKPQSGANWRNAIDKCLETFPDQDDQISHQGPMLNHSLQFCSALLKDNIRNTNTLQQNCERLYTDNNHSPAYDPASLVPAYGGYVCFGIYDGGLHHTERAGYIGRCWTSPQGLFKTCVAKEMVSAADGGCNVASNQNTCTYGGSKNWFKNDKTTGYNYNCTKNNLNQCGDTDWTLQYVWNDGSGVCKAGELPPGATPGQWEGPTSADTTECIIQAAIDYCNDTSVPEVIDPSDQAGDTTKVWNIPGVLTDSQIIAQIGGTHPLATMKGYIHQPTRPRGVVHNVARDLRLGVMGIHYVGAATECTDEYLTDGIERYCPQNNKDGAQLFAHLEAGDLVTDENDTTYLGGKRRHMDDVSSAINTIRATSWTPLGEALFSALGYYTQNIHLCLNCPIRNNDGSCANLPMNYCEDFPIMEDPVQYWCQDNHILLITEGESTADVNRAVANLATFPYPHSPTPFLSLEEGDNVDNYVDPDGNALLAPRTCGDSLHSSTYLTAMTWWGQNVLPLYKERYFIDPDGRETPKRNIYTHVVATGALSAMGAGTGECDPEVLMRNAAYNGGTDEYHPGENPQQLEENLYAVLDDILSRASAGSAASVISSSRSGAGAVYQAVFWPEYRGENGTKVSWVGDVHSLFVSSEGLMYEDTNQDGKLYPEAKGGADRQIMFYFSSVVNKTRGCYDIQGFWANNFVCPEDPVENCDGTTCVEIQDIKYLWSANRRLAAIDDVMTERTIYTWNDANNDGIVDPGEWFKLTDLYADDLNNLTGSKLNELNQIAAVNARGSVGKDFLTPNDWNVFAEYDASMTAEQREQEALNVLVAWLQGKDDERLRSRRIERTVDGVLTTTTWRLGDVIHSTPMVVARPAEAYHYIYRDPTYAKFASRWVNRRNMIYFGGNDGMLHAVNGGFYFENGTQFCCTNEVNSDGSCKVPPSNGICSDTYDLGEEVWAYIPYNLQPHLKCLADRFYAHKYYVDQRPRIFDVQIFPEDADHVGGWGTILVGAMRFGGAPIEATELNGNPDDERIFTSAFFILDITNPDKPPVLLGEMTLTSEQEDGKDKYTNLNYTTSSPSMIIMRDGEAGNAQSEWYLVMGNGPTDQDGTNDVGQEGTLAILPLEWLKGRLTSWTEAVPKAASSFDIKPFRIPNKEPGATGNSTEGGRFLVPLNPKHNASFISDIISVDYNIDVTALDDLGGRYRTDAVYFGTVDGTDFKKYPEENAADLPDQFYWDGGGRIFRLVTKVLDANGDEIASKPSQWAGRWSDDLPYSQGPIRQLADLQMPIISGPSIGYDGDNYWIYAGTGRFFGDKDKTDDGWYNPDTKEKSKISFFGLKEPIKAANSGFDHWKGGTPPSASSNCSDAWMTWGRINWDINEKDNSQLNHNGKPGERGLMQTDKIYVAYAPESVFGGGISYLICSTGDDKDCFPDPVWEHVIEELSDPDNPNSTIEVPLFRKLRQYIAGTGCSSFDDQGISTGLDGWYREFHDPRERNLGTAALLGGLLTYTSYQPFNDPCSPEGESYLYGVHFQTGTAWTDTVFGTFEYDIKYGQHTFVKDRLSLGRGLSTAPSLHVGTGDHAAKAFIQTSTGEIIEITQENLPLSTDRSGRQSWSDRCQ